MYTEHNTTQNNLHFTKPQVNELVFMPKLNKTYFCFRVKSVFPGKKTVVATTGVVLLAIVSNRQRILNFSPASRSLPPE